MPACARANPLHGNNLSDAWAKAFVDCYDSSGNSIAPGIISFDVENTGDWELENSNIRDALEHQLGIQPGVTNPSNIETVAGTIFPEAIWRRCGQDRNKLFAEYRKLWPAISKCKTNKLGTYFRRLTAYGLPEIEEDSKVNQLDEILSAWDKGIRRHSALQASVFDPYQDHRATPYLGFPCLQQVVFHTKGSNGSDGLEVVAFYANQILLEKAYGNYLGLYRLGKFMAGEMGLNLTGVTCIASHLTLAKSGTTKTELKPLIETLKQEVTHD